MKLIFVLFIIMITSQHASSQSIEEAYKREKNYLRSQKDALFALKGELKFQFIKSKAAAEKEIAKLQSELTLLEQANTTSLEEYKAIEKITKEGVQISGQIEKQNLKIAESLSSTTAKLGLKYTENTERDEVKKFEMHLDEVLSLIEASSSKAWRSHAFINENNQLISGEILFNGLYSAWGKINSKIVSLAPYNKDFLKVIPETSESVVYLFTPDFTKVSVLSAKTWKESVADAVPGVVMALIMLTVFGLFVMLAKS